MKEWRIRWGVVLAILTVCQIDLSAQTGNVPAINAASQPLPQPTPYSIIGRAPNSQVWERIIYEKAPDGTIVPKKHHYTELASGLNYWNNGQWIESKPEIDLQPDGTASATQGQHQVYFPNDIYNGVIEMVTPDGRQLQSRPMGISYDDGTNTVLIAVLTNSVGQLVSSNQIVYPDAFTDFKADLVCTYRRGGFEQDVVFREQPPAPEQFGLSSQTARLQLLTEFFDAPEPALATSPVNPSDELSDTTLKFGQTTFGRGKAFVVGQTEPKIPVYKSWLQLQGRTFLVEQVPFRRIQPSLESLPPSAAVTAATPANLILHKVSATRLLPSKRLVQKSGTNAIQMAGLDLDKERGVVLDYVTVDSDQTNFTFQGDTTYHITGWFNISDTATFEGGTVVKFDTSGASIGINNIVCQTGPYRPAVLTAQDDDSVGEQINGSSGSPYGYYAGSALSFQGTSGLIIGHFRICHAQIAVDDDGAEPYAAPDLAFDMQIINCEIGYNNGSEDGNGMTFENALFSGVNCGFEAANIECQGEQVTFNNCNVLLDSEGGPGCYGFFINSVFANVTNLEVDSLSYADGNNNGFYKGPTFGSVQFTNTFYPFQAVGAGSFYLTNGCAFRNVGSTGIDSLVLADLATKTTWPPVSYGSWENLTLGPQALRDTNAAPDLGYHYDPLDYVIGGNLDYGLGFLPGTVVSGGIALDNFRAGVGFNGTVTSPCWYVTADTVQENSGYAGVGIGTTSDGVDAGGVEAAFTKFSTLAGEGTVYFSDPNDVYPSYSASDCEFYGGDIGSGGENSAYNLNNCLFWRANVGDDNGDQWSMGNCLFWNGTLWLQGGSGWMIEDTAFDGTSVTNDGSVSTNHGSAFDHNAFLTTDGLVAYGGVHDVVVTNYNWQSNQFGNYYLPPGSPLIDAGSTTADVLGLSRFTTQTNQVPETNSVVDIGYHYVAYNPPVADSITNGPFCPNSSDEINLSTHVSPSGLTNFIVLTPPAHGSLTNLGSGEFYYMPATNYAGVDNFTYEVNNGLLDSAPATITFIMGDPDVTPNDETAMTGTNQAVTLTLTANSQAFCPDTFTYTIVTGPTNGYLTSVSGDNITYVPTSGFEGVDHFIFNVNDGPFPPSTSPAIAVIYVVAGPQLTAECNTNGGILLSWTLDAAVQQMEARPSPAMSILDFNVYRSTTPGGPYSFIGTVYNTSQTNFLDRDVTEGDTYYYVVTFDYEDYTTYITYESPYSNEAGFTACSLPSPIRPGFNQITLARNDDDCSNVDGFSVSNLLPNLQGTIGFSIKYFGTTYTNLYVNNNGNITFGSFLADYTPTNNLVNLHTNIIAPFWADVDTRAIGSGLVTYGTNTVDGHAAFGVTWPYVGYYGTTYGHDDKLNAFQVVLINRLDRASGDYDIEFNYDQIQWEAGDVSGGNDGLGGHSARVGFASVSGSTFEFIGSGTNSAFLDTNLVTGLILHTNNYSDNIFGRYVFQFHDGTNSLAHP